MNDFSLNMTSPGPESTLLIPQSSAAKQPKKRKSWGQALPEPKTTLPPRKRAKTDDEKEQRRIERIKRNRAAAHNSRERKRVEAERLEVENHHLKHQLSLMQQYIIRTQARLTEYQQLLPNALPQVSTEDFANMKFDLTEIKDERFVPSACWPSFHPSLYLHHTSYPDTPGSSSNDTIDPRASLAASSPGDEMHTPFIKAESPSTSVTMPTPCQSATGAPLDQTRHSAAMLCDLQCRSSRAYHMASQWWAQLILNLMHLNIMTMYKALLTTTWTLWPTHMAKIMEMASSKACSIPTSSRMIRATTRTTRRRQRFVPSATSTTPSSLLSFLSLLLLSQTSAQFSLAKGLSQEDASAARLALMSKLAELKKAVADGDTDETSHLHGRSRRFTDYQEERGSHDDGGVG